MVQVCRRGIYNLQSTGFMPWGQILSHSYSKLHLKPLAGAGHSLDSIVTRCICLYDFLLNNKKLFGGWPEKFADVILNYFSLRKIFAQSKKTKKQLQQTEQKKENKKKCNFLDHLSEIFTSLKFLCKYHFEPK